MPLFRLVLTLFAAVLAGPAWAHDAKLGDLVIMEPRARATIGQAKAGAAYLTVVNHGAAADRLVAVSTPVAAKAELHTHLLEEGVMKMRRVEAIEVDPMASTALEPGGYHVMLMGLAAPLVEGEAFPLTLTFEAAGSVEVEVHIQAIGAMDSAAGEGHGHGGHASASGGHDHGGHGGGAYDHSEHHEGGHHDASHHGGHHHGPPIQLATGETAPTLDFILTADPVGGWNLQILAENFRFAPERVNGPHRDGEGHAHLYVNGKKVARIYGPWFHVGTLASGRNEITVSLNANDHRHLMVGETALTATKVVHVP